MFADRSALIVHTSTTSKSVAQLQNDIPVLGPEGQGSQDNVDLNKPVSIPGSTGDKQVYLETYGCQMNVSDSEIVASLLVENGYGLTHEADDADVILINTCAIRENAEQKVRRRLATIRKKKTTTRPDKRRLTSTFQKRNPTPTSHPSVTIRMA